MDNNYSADDLSRYQQRIKIMADEQYYRQMREASGLLQHGEGQQAAEFWSGCTNCIPAMWMWPSTWAALHPK